MFSKFKKQSISKLIDEYERTYTGNHHKIKNVFLKNTKSNKLIIVLSGFNGKEAEGAKAKYNYIRTIHSFKTNKLFILDEVNNIPTYYYGVQSKPTYLEDCSNLIKKTMIQSNITPENVIIVGSSKGGTGAIILGNELKLGWIISGTPQYYTMDYLQELNQKTKNLILDNMLRINSDIEIVQNDIKERMLNLSDDTKLFLHAGNEDPHYIKHLRPYMSMLTKRKKLYSLDLKHYKGHHNVIDWFPDFLKYTIEEIIAEKYNFKYKNEDKFE